MAGARAHGPRPHSGSVASPLHTQLPVDGAGRVRRVFRINSYPDASTAKLSGMRFRRIPLCSGLCGLELKPSGAGVRDGTPPVLDTKPAF